MNNKRNPKSIRIVHILYKYAFGGMETVLTNMITGMGYDDFEHYIISLTPYVEDMHKMMLPGIKIYTVNKQEGKDFKSYVEIRRLLKEIGPDIVHTYNIGAIDSVLTSLFIGKKSAIHSEHGRDVSDPEGKNRKYNILRYLLSPFFNSFVVVSDELKAWLSEVVGINKNKIVRIYNGVDTEKFMPYSGNERVSSKKTYFSRSGKIIGTIGRLDPVKNHALMIKAFSRYLGENPGSEASMVIIGDGPEKTNLEKLVESLGLQERVILAGARHNVEKMLPSFDIYVQSSIAEGIPMTILEAMACGLPVISTNVGGISEVIRHGVNGYLVKSGDLKDMCDAFSRIVGDESICRKMGGAAREDVVKTFSVKQMCQDYKDLYHLLAGK